MTEVGCWSKGLCAGVRGSSEREREAGRGDPESEARLSKPETQQQQHQQLQQPGQTTTASRTRNKVTKQPTDSGTHWSWHSGANDGRFFAKLSWHCAKKWHHWWVDCSVACSGSSLVVLGAKPLCLIILWTANACGQTSTVKSNVSGDGFCAGRPHINCRQIGRLLGPGSPGPSSRFLIEVQTQAHPHPQAQAPAPAPASASA
uniref:HDC09600 n=1 Tax=Drosophila melanogaster TaxID=7227 RepID=Q6ILD7_DROME|nr:TPA_inf: HDC09600 [Drosophila melanogaster]